MDDEEKELVEEIEEPSTEIDEETTEEVEETVENTPADEELLKKKKKKKIIIIVSIIIALLLIAGITIFLLTRNKKDNKPEEKQTDQITITFDSNGGNEIKAIKVKKNEKVNFPIPERENYLFLGWYNVEEKVLRTSTFDKDVTLTAHWEELNANTKTMTITFDTDGGTPIDSQTIVCGAPLDIPTWVQKDDHYFNRWIDDNGNEITRNIIVPCQDLNLHAEFTKIDYSNNIKCPEGYTLNDYKKCVSHVAPIKIDCKDNQKVSNGICYDTTDYNYGTKVCDGGYRIYKPDGSYTSSSDKGELFDNVYCGYYVWEGYTKDTCITKYDDESPTWANNKCYSLVTKNAYSIDCDEGYYYFFNVAAKRDFNIDSVDGICIKAHIENTTCPEGYILDKDNLYAYQGKVCIKEIDPIE